ncbi:MAG: response regulator [Chloroflexi bacterium]|nr:response regulator [Chloroflexota bacterium]
MSATILTLEIRFEHDVVLVRQRARQIAGLLGFDAQNQTRLATAVSEIARNAFNYAGEGKVEFLVEDTAPPQMFLVRISDEGPGIADLPAILEGGKGLGIISARRLMDQFDIKSVPGKGTTVLLGKAFPPEVPVVTAQDLARIASKLARRAPLSPFEDIQQQNQELLRTLGELHKHQEELTQLNRELEDTNRGVLALYAELDERAEDLRRASELKSRFLSYMSHELRVPLSSILALSRILLDRTNGELTAEQEKQVTFVRKAAGDLLEMINDLLDLAKIEAGRITVRPAEFEVAQVFSGLRGMMRPLDISPSIELIFEDPVGLPPLYTDESKVSQILRNLVSNALKFTERGEVRVSAAMEPEGKAVVFSVADTGIGIAPEDQERIFEEFVQLEAPVKQRVKGTGLGLALSRRLVELLGGSLSVESELGVGSTFTVIIPLVYAGPDAESPVVAIPHEIDLLRFPVLVVEDDPSTVLLYERYLQESGFQAIPARTVKEARQALKQVRPMAVVLDILLEEENGWDLLVEMKRAKATRDIPILVCTIIDDQREQGMVLGAVDYCVKPIERQWLLNKLKMLDPVEKILIIDDEEVARYAFNKLLAGTRYTVIEAADGPEGLRRAREEGPQVIFLDLIMPEMSGFEVLDELKSDPATRNIPVVIYTGKDLEEEERRRLMEGAVAVLSKATTSREEAIAQIREALVTVRRGQGDKETQ